MINNKLDLQSESLNVNRLPNLEKSDRMPRRCLYCGQFAPLVWVHGHGQCASCGINVDECCRGENCSFD